ncbi:MAG TPA: hypothetical protein VMZ28_22960, partial [Kofleriaceae bacterium]|nr:hypothetical protein [Kofleriaceae bacterium]
ASPAFGITFVSELENRVLSGETLNARYGLICQVFRNFDPPCQKCPQPTDGDLCHACECPSVKRLSDEHAMLASSPAELTAGVSTGEIERRYGSAYVYQYSFNDPEGLADAMFTAFLGKRPSADERRNAGMLVYGRAGGAPRGLLFHRHGVTFSDLSAIVFGSEVYREAIVDGVFGRYLGRGPSSVERAHFVGTLDAQSPDLRPVIRAVVSSREYFAQ